MNPAQPWMTGTGVAGGPNGVAPGPNGPPPGWGPPPSAPLQQSPAAWNPPGAPAQPAQPAPGGWNPSQAPGQPPPWAAPQGVPQQWSPPQQPQQPPPQPQQTAPQAWAQPQPQYAPPQQQYAPMQPQQYAPAPQQYSQPPQQNWGGGQEEDPFGGLDTAMPEGQRGEFFEEGSFHIRIDKTTMIKSRKGKTLYTIETEVIASDCPEQPAGTRCTAMIDMSNRDMRDKNLLNFLAAVMGYDPGTFARGTLPPVGGSWSNLARLTLGNDQPLRGRELAVRVVTRDTRGGGEFNDLGWLPKHMLAIGAMRAPKPAESAPSSQADWGQLGVSNGAPNGAQAAWGPNPGAGPAGAWAPQAQPQRQAAPQAWGPPQGPQNGRPQPQAWGPPSAADQIPF